MSLDDKWTKTKPLIDEGNELEMHDGSTMANVLSKYNYL